MNQQITVQKKKPQKVKAGKASAEARLRKRQNLEEQLLISKSKLSESSEDTGRASGHIAVQEQSQTQLHIEEPQRQSAKIQNQSLTQNSWRVTTAIAVMCMGALAYITLKLRNAPSGITELPGGTPVRRAENGKKETHKSQNREETPNSQNREEESCMHME